MPNWAAKLGKEAGTIGRLTKSVLAGIQAIEKVELEETLANLPRRGQKITLRGATGYVSHGSAVQERYSVTGTLTREGIRPTGGWAKWSNVARRQRTSQTVLEGYEPVTLEVPLILDVGVEQPLGPSGHRQGDIEAYVERLEWMGGRGRLFKGKPAHPGRGEPPILEIESKGSLVPLWYQNRNGEEIWWVLEDMSFGPEPVRKESGRRTRQEVTLTLKQYVGSFGNSRSAAAQRIIQTQEQSFVYMTVGGGVNTFTDIAKKYNQTTQRIGEAAQEIRKANPGLGSSVNKPLPHGKRIRIPVSATSKRF